ncbi:hypothetical protein [Roseovarius sp. 2305UL8-3]|uniref:hypothetical protein n=1 Tax=Roseovarius conchicola TaxID=3121636 RepID=UPI0035271804
MRIWMVGATYTLAFVAALASIWAFMALGVDAFFENATGSSSLTMLLSMLVGLCVFSLVYGLASGRALKWRYWAYVPVLLLVILAGSLQLVWNGYVTVIEAIAFDVLLVFFAGFLACLQRDAVAAPASGAIE